MARRGDPDPLLLQAVSERLARLLAEDAPRRAAEDPEAGTAGAESPAVPPDPRPEPVPDELPEPRRFGRAHLGVVVVVLLLGVLVAGWTLVRARPVALAAPGTPPVVVTVGPAPSGTGPPTPVPTAAPTSGGASGAVTLPEE